MLKKQNKNIADRFHLAVRFRSEEYGPLLIDSDLEQGSPMMRFAKDALNDHRSAEAAGGMLAIRKLLPKASGWCAALFNLSPDREIALFGMQRRDARIRAMGSPFRHHLGDWRGEDQRDFPNKELLQRGSLMQALAHDTGRPVGSTALYRDDASRLYRFESVWAAVGCGSAPQQSTVLALGRISLA